MAKGEELVKYVTGRVVQYIEKPKELRKAERARRRQRSEPWTVRWFGLVPMAVAMLFSRRKKTPPAETHPHRGQ